MSVTAAIGAAIPAFITFICTPDDTARSTLSYVVSFETSGSRLENVVVIWPNGSQSHDRWKGKVLDNGFQIERRDRSSSKSIDIAWLPENRNAGILTSRSNFWGGHIIMESEDKANCVVHSEVDPVRLAQ